MKTILVAAQKGGAGKTTLSRNLAVAAAADGKSVLCVDLDPQGSLRSWWQARLDENPAMLEADPAPAALRKTLQAAAKVFDLAVIDTPPSITSALATIVQGADLVLIPARPSPHDLRAVGGTVAVATSAGRPFAFTVTQAKPTAKLTVQAVAALSEHGPVAPAIVHDRVDYAASMTDGRTVIEVDPKGRSADEIRSFWKFIKSRLHANTKAKKKETV